MQNEISNLIDQEESRLASARDEALELAKNKPTQANLKALKRAEKDLSDYRQARYESGSGDGFTSLLDVVAWLDSEGWKISKSSIYEHKTDGKIRADSNGHYSSAAVVEYAATHLQKKDGSTTTGRNLQEQKALEEIRRISSDASMRELKLQELRGELISREQVEIELAARASDLKTHLDASARTSSTRIIKLVGGDVQKAPELISFLLGINRKMLDNYRRPIQGDDGE